MKLREVLAGLIGPEVHTHRIVWNGRTQAVRFRQLSGEQARQLRIAVPDELDEEGKGLHFMAQVVAASMLGPDGAPVGHSEEFDSLPEAVKLQLWNAAAVTNGLVQLRAQPAPDAAEADDEAAKPPKG